MTSDPFLAGIAADPADRVRRLVYADWLDDHADPRGELVRVEEAMRDLPAFADEFWALKARRNELRPLAGADWLAALRYGVDALPVFPHGVPDDPRGRWRLIREFLERWHRVPMPDCGGRAAEVAETEARLGVTLGQGVRDFVALVSDHRAGRPSWRLLHSSVLLEPTPVPDGASGWDGVSLAECNDNQLLVVLQADLLTPDPPVYELWPDAWNGPSDADARCHKPVGRLTDWLIDSVCRDTRGFWSIGFSFANTSETAAHVAAFFPQPASVGGRDVYELDGLAAWMTTNGWRSNVELRAAFAPIPLPARRAPAVWDRGTRSAFGNACPPQSRPALDWAWRCFDAWNATIAEDIPF